MLKTYLIQKNKISELLNELDNFSSRIDYFNNKYGKLYSYGFDIYSEKDEKSKGALYIAEINIERNENEPKLSD